MTPPLPPRLGWPPWLQTLAGGLSAEWFLAWLLRRYEGEPAGRMRFLGMGELVSLPDPAAIAAVAGAEPGRVRAGAANRRVMGGSVGASSVLLLDGDEHLRMRRLLSKPFHGEGLRALAPVVEEIAEAEVARWPVGEAFPLLPRMNAITLEVVLRAVVGARAGERLDRLRATVPRVMAVPPMAVVLEAARPAVARGRRGRLLPWVRVREEVRGLLRDEVRAHRADPAGRTDLLARLIEARDDEGRGLGDDELVDQLLTMLLAGHETSASVLAFAFERLLRHPEAHARVLEELDAGERDGPWLEATVQETLRTRPPLEAAWRTLRSPMEVEGRTVPAGPLVGLAIRAVHRRPDLWPDPRAFRPERFLTGRPAPHTLVPFGAGPRRCLGASLALLELRTVLRVVLSRVEMRGASPWPERQTRLQRFVVVPARGARVVVTARRPAQAGVATTPTAG